MVCDQLWNDIFNVNLKLFQKIEDGGIPSHSLYEVSNHLTQTPKHFKTVDFRILQTNILNEHRCKTPQQNISKPNPTAHKKIICHDAVGFMPGCNDGLI
jgi:hypothetical protein